MCTEYISDKLGDRIEKTMVSHYDHKFDLIYCQWNTREPVTLCSASFLKFYSDIPIYIPLFLPSVKPSVAGVAASPFLRYFSFFTSVTRDSLMHVHDVMGIPMSPGMPATMHEFVMCVDRLSYLAAKSYRPFSKNIFIAFIS